MCWQGGFPKVWLRSRGKNDKYGFIDKTGKFVIQPQFDRVGDFSEGLAAVKPVDAELARQPGIYQSKGSNCDQINVDSSRQAHEG